MDKKDRPSVFSTSMIKAMPYLKMDRTELEYYETIRSNPDFNSVLIPVSSLHREMDSLKSRLEFVRNEIKRIRATTKPNLGELQGLEVFGGHLEFMIEEFSKIVTSAITSNKTKKGEQQ